MTTTEAAKIAAKKVISQFFFVCSLKDMVLILMGEFFGDNFYRATTITLLTQLAVYRPTSFEGTY